LTGKIRDLLAKNFTDISVQGEISNCREAQSGHIYFTLKDDRAQVRCVYFKQQQRGVKFRPEDGLQVTIRGSISVYEQRGEYQIYVEKIDLVGQGALQLAFEQLKKRLEAEGLFDAARKKPLPLLPNRIGIITSPKGAAVRDVVRILTRRFPNVHLMVFPVRVRMRTTSRTAAPLGEVMMPMRLGRSGNGFLRAASNRPSASRRFFNCSKASCSAPCPTKSIFST